MKKLLRFVFGDPIAKEMGKLQSEILEVNKLEEDFKKLSDEELRGKTDEFKKRLVDGEKLEDMIYETFATVRESAVRVLGQRHYDVQLIGGLVLHRRGIAEMRTGEGKTLTSTLATYTSALEGKGVHLVTPNDYLAKRDAVWMGELLAALGLSVGVVQAQQESFIYDGSYIPETPEDEEDHDETASFKVEMEYLRPCNRKEAYAADVTYGTNNEFGFDFLRDNMVMDASSMVQRPLYHAIIDEIDSILVDEARTPLIISAPAQEGTDQYYRYAQLVRGLKIEEHYTVDEKARSALLTSEGIEAIEKAMGVGNLYTEAGMKVVHHLENALKAEAIFKKDKDYVVQGQEIVIVDEFTGRMMYGRRYSEGLHQAIEAKENVAIQRESETLATITFQNYFRMYEKLSGMTGTAETEAEEFGKIYGLEVFSIPTNKPIVRKDLQDRIYASERGKFQAVIREIKERAGAGQPILVGTASIEKNELFSELLDEAGVEHQMLNAKNHEREAQVVAQAGKPGAVTVATNMAGRGVDIVLGGNPPTQEDAKIVKEAGGLAVIATERHDSRRIDNQLRGRSGRQGDPGMSQFYISVEDDLMRIFGSDRMKNIMQKLNFPEDMPVENGIVSKSLETAQHKVESHNYDIRKHLLEYDDVLNRHRTSVYERRRRVLRLADSENLKDWEELHQLALLTIHTEFKNIVSAYLDREDGTWDVDGLVDSLRLVMPLPDNLKDQILAHATDKEEPEARIAAQQAVLDLLSGMADEQYEFLRKQIGEPEEIAKIEKNAMLRAIDSLWVEHLVAVRYLRNSIGLQGYGQRDPLIEYKKIAFNMYHDLMAAIDNEITTTLFRIGHASVEAKSLMDRVGVTMAGAAKIMGAKHATQSPKGTPGKAVEKVGRNEPCTCGSGKKYKKCHGSE
ncbi:MAG: preprotein translocase subunit SecA [Parcubacteria group bacterium]|nr:preprotein translocase subunit SecA [Parcubacteria group bacterium]